MNPAGHFYCQTLSYSKINSLPATAVCLSICEISLDPDQTQQDVGPDLDLNCLAFDGIHERYFWKCIKKKMEKNSANSKFLFEITQHAKS